MFGKFFKNKEEIFYRLGNLLVLLFFLGSFVWFLMTAVRIVNASVTIQRPKTAATQMIRLEDFEKLKILFNRNGIGFAVLEETN